MQLGGYPYRYPLLVCAASQVPSLIVYILNDTMDMIGQYPMAGWERGKSRIFSMNKVIGVVIGGFNASGNKKRVDVVKIIIK